ncbi:MAG: geranylgeranylglycerol-phosphate geranylgeranyltransferase [Bacteroidota bacterium]
MLAYLKLFRWSNLLVVLFTMVLFRYSIVIPILNEFGSDPVMTTLQFSLLVLATLLISAAGYAINDYFDLRIDRINKPGKILLGRLIPRRKAIFYHSLFNILALIIGLYLSYVAHRWQLVFVFLVIPALLWLYSIRYKRKFLAGNLIVAALSAFVVAIVWVFDAHMLIAYDQMDSNALIAINYFVRIYALFAFFIGIIREITKDAEDIEGDRITGCKTIPVVVGIKNTTNMITFLVFGSILAVAFFQIWFWKRELYLLTAYLLIGVQIPFLVMFMKSMKAKTKNDFSQLSRWAKLIMITGISSMLLFYYYFSHTDFLSWF